MTWKEEVLGKTVIMDEFYALMHIIRSWLISYQSHSTVNGIMCSQESKTQWEVNTDHTTSGIKKLV